VIASPAPSPRQCGMQSWFIHAAAITGRVAAGLVGCLCFYLAFFLYEDEEGVWQNRIENLWLTVYDRAKLTDRTSTALFNRIGDTLRQGFDRMFGHRLFSVRSFCVSITTSFVGVLILILISLGPIFLIAGLVLILLFFVSILSPGRQEQRWHKVTLQWSGPFALAATALTFLIFSIKDVSRYLTTFGLEIPIALGFSFLMDYLTLTIVRKSFTAISTTISITRIVTIMVQLFVLGAFVVGCSLFVAVVTFSIEYTTSFTMGGMTFLVSVLNLSTTLYCFIPMISLAVVLVHRVTWPILSRAIYPFCRHRFLVNRKVLLAVGSICFTFAFDIEQVGARGLLKLFS
jgi:hypothetical protein